MGGQKNQNEDKDGDLENYKILRVVGITVDDMMHKNQIKTFSFYKCLWIYSLSGGLQVEV